MVDRAEFSQSVYQAGLAAGLTDAAARVTAGQAALESNYGNSAPGFNYFGVKAGRGWDGPVQRLWTYEGSGASRVRVLQNFRVYASPEEAIADRVRVMDRAWPGFNTAETVGDALDILPRGRFGRYYTGSQVDYERAVNYVNQSYLSGSLVPPTGIQPIIGAYVAGGEPLAYSADPHYLPPAVLSPAGADTWDSPHNLGSYRDVHQPSVQALDDTRAWVLASSAQFGVRLAVGGGPDAVKISKYNSVGTPVVGDEFDDDPVGGGVADDPRLLELASPARLVGGDGPVSWFTNSPDVAPGGLGSGVILSSGVVYGAMAQSASAVLAAPLNDAVHVVEVNLDGTERPVRSTTLVAKGTPETGFNTVLTPAGERDYQRWKLFNAPDDTGLDYDLRGAYAAGISADPQSGHWPDTFKKPSEPTFSVESQYAHYAPLLAGHWDGDTYVPPALSLEDRDAAYTARQMAQALAAPTPHAQAVAPVPHARPVGADAIAPAAPTDLRTGLPIIVKNGRRVLDTSGLTKEQIHMLLMKQQTDPKSDGKTVMNSIIGTIVKEKATEAAPAVSAAVGSTATAVGSTLTAGIDAGKSRATDLASQAPAAMIGLGSMLEGLSPFGKKPSSSDRLSTIIHQAYGGDQTLPDDGAHIAGIGFGERPTIGTEPSQPIKITTPKVSTSWVPTAVPRVPMSVALAGTGYADIGATFDRNFTVPAHLAPTPPPDVGHKSQAVEQHKPQPVTTATVKPQGAGTVAPSAAGAPAASGVKPFKSVSTTPAAKPTFKTVTTVNPAFTAWEKHQATPVGEGVKEGHTGQSAPMPIASPPPPKTITTRVPTGSAPKVLAKPAQPVVVARPAAVAHGATTRPRPVPASVPVRTRDAQRAVVQSTGNGVAAAQPQRVVTIASGKSVPVGTVGTAQGGRYVYQVQPDGSVKNLTTGRTTAQAPANQNASSSNPSATHWDKASGSWV